MTGWQTGIPPFVEVDEENEYCYALCFYYDRWWLSDLLYKANYDEGCFESAQLFDGKPLKLEFQEDNPPWHNVLRWQRIIPHDWD